MLQKLTYPDDKSFSRMMLKLRFTAFDGNEDEMLTVDPNEPQTQRHSEHRIVSIDSSWPLTGDTGSYSCRQRRFTSQCTLILRARMNFSEMTHAGKQWDWVRPIVVRRYMSAVDRLMQL